MNTAYVIECRTGCSCCSYDNHYRGPYKTKEDAENRIKYFMSGDYYPVASQYAKRGRYSIEEVTIEEISGGRFIINDSHVVHDLDFVTVNSDGDIGNSCGGPEHDYPGERFDAMESY